MAGYSNTRRERADMNRLLVGLFIGILCMAGCNLPSNPDAETAAISVAETWLELVDSQRYAESWEQAAEYFQSVITKDKWQQVMQGGRRPFGETISRKLRSQRYTTSLPGAPDGEYVVIQFNTSFENKKSAIETLTPMLDKDGKWRVSGYYIR